MPAEAHTAKIAHHTPGRMRLKLPSGIKQHAHLLHEIRLLLKPKPGVKDVSINTTTGSVLIHYDSDKWQNARAELEQAANDSGLFAIAPEGEEIQAVEEEAEFLAEHSDIARTIVNFIKDVNQKVKRATNNAVDLNVLVPLGAAIYSFLEIESEVATPLWVTLGIFSFNSFVALHSHPPDKSDAAPRNNLLT